MDDADRRALVFVLRVGLHHAQAEAAVNGTRVDTGPARRLLNALVRQRTKVGPVADGYVTIGSLEAVSARQVRRMAAAGRIRAFKAGTTWMVQRDDVEREIYR